MASHVLDDENPGGNGRARSPVPGPPRPLGEAQRAVGATGNARAPGGTARRPHLHCAAGVPTAEPGRTPLSRRPPGAPITHVLMGFRCPRGSRLASLRLVSLWVPRLDHSERRGFGVAASPCHPVALPRELLGPGLVPGSAMPLVSSSRFFASLWRFRFDGASFLDVTRLASPLSRFINMLSSAIGNVLSGDSHISVALRSVFGDVTCSFLWAAVPCFFVRFSPCVGMGASGEQPPGPSLRSGAEIFASLLGRRVRRTLETPLGSHVLLARARRLLAEARLVCGPRPPSFGPRCVGLPDAALSQRTLHPPPPPTRLPRLSAFGPGQNRAWPLSHPPTETGPRAAPHSLVPGEGLRPSNVVDPPPDLT